MENNFLMARAMKAMINDRAKFIGRWGGGAENEQQAVVMKFHMFNVGICLVWLLN
jgi:hypothetical protein